MESLPGYDAWKLRGPDEGPEPTCAVCGQVEVDCHRNNPEIGSDEDGDPSSTHDFEPADRDDDGGVAYDTARDEKLERDHDEANREERPT